MPERKHFFSIDVFPMSFPIRRYFRGTKKNWWSFWAAPQSIWAAKNLSGQLSNSMIDRCQTDTYLSKETLIFWKSFNRTLLQDDNDDDKYKKWSGQVSNPMIDCCRTDTYLFKIPSLDLSTGSMVDNCGHIRHIYQFLWQSPQKMNCSLACSCWFASLVQKKS